MLNNTFTKRYKKIPIAKFVFQAKADIYENYITLPQFHKEFEILYINSGSLCITINTRSFIARSGDIVLISPYVFHGIRMVPNESTDYTCFCFDLSLLSDSKLIAELESRKIATTSHIETNSSHIKPIRDLFFSIKTAFDGEFPYWEHTVRGNIILLFAYLFQNRLTENFPTSSLEILFQTNVLNYLEENYGSDINSGSAAQELNFNHSYFCRRFKNYFGIKFTDFLRSFRLDKAKSCLKNTEKSITSIALQCGFSNSSHFAYCFKEEYGTTPRDYRKKAKEK